MSDNYNGYYSLIQFCPVLERAERLNVGVLLFCPGRNYIATRMLPNSQRIQSIFGHDSVDEKRFTMVLQGLFDRISIEKDRVQTLGDLKAFIRTRANNLRLTAPNPIRVTNPKEQLTSLFDELVLPPTGLAVHSAAESTEKYL